jgi:murein DD-endopeptidase MepM/ murein hydrolase activator NlpD
LGNLPTNREVVLKITKIGYCRVGGDAVHFSQTSAESRISNAAGALALTLLTLSHGGALAEDGPPPSHSEVAASGDNASRQNGVIAGAQVFIAPPIGEVSIDRTADAVGGKVYASRSRFAGTAAIVSFSNRPEPLRRNSSAAGLIAPLSQAMLTSRFGAVRSQGGGDPRRHAGVDLAAPAGSPVMAAQDGRVSVANWAGGYGLLVVLDHSDGMQTRYAHLSRIAVAKGQVVRRGEIVGLVGSTGRSTGPHLHFELRQDGRPVDPLSAAP